MLKPIQLSICSGRSDARMSTVARYARAVGAEIGFAVRPGDGGGGGDR